MYIYVMSNTDQSRHSLLQIHPFFEERGTTDVQMGRVGKHVHRMTSHTSLRLYNMQYCFVCFYVCTYVCKNNHV